MEFESEDVMEMTSGTEVEGNTINVTVVMPVEAPAEDPVPLEVVSEDISEDPAVVYQTDTTIDALVHEEDSSLALVVQNLFGEYVPRTQTVTIIGSDGSQVVRTECVSGLAGLDWYWLSGVCLFGVVLVSFFKIVGAVVKK